jgi:hypothetical protein
MQTVFENTASDKGNAKKLFQAYEKIAVYMEGTLNTAGRSLAISRQLLSSGSSDATLRHAWMQNVQVIVGSMKVT